MVEVVEFAVVLLTVTVVVGRDSTHSTATTTTATIEFTAGIID